MAIERRNAERKRRASDHLFQAMFMAMDEGAILLNKSGEVVAVNPAAENILGFATSELMGCSAAECVQALNIITADETPLSQEYRSALLAFQTGKPRRHMTMGTRRPDGTLVWLSVNAQPMVSDGESGPYAVVYTFRDITGHRLAKRYEQFRLQTLELLSGGASLQDVLEGIVRGVEQHNHGMICSILLLDIQGKRFGKAIAPSLPDFFTAAIDGIEIGIGCCGTAAATGERVIVDDIMTHPYWISCKELAARAGLAACWSEPIRSSSGQVLGTFAVYHREAHSPAEFDISLIEKSAHLASIAIERKLSEAALRTSEERMRLFFESQLVGMAITSPEKGWIQVNDKICKMLGYAREELARLSWAELTYPEDLAADTAQFERMLDGEIDNYRLEKRFVRKDGGIVFTDLAVGCVRQPDHSVDYVLAMLEDITESKLAELERQAHARSLECLDQVNKAIQGATDLEQMMSDVLDVVLAVFGCDRAFLLHPCDPDATEWRVPMERTRPEYPGLLALGVSIPMDAEVAQTLRLLLASNGPVKFGPGTQYALPTDVSEQFGFKGFMSMALHPKLDKPWQFGIHQCSHARIWTRDEEALFEKIGWRLSDALTGLLMYRNLQASEQEFRTLAENLPDILIRYDCEGRRAYVNPALERMVVTAEQMIGKTLRETNPTGMRKPEAYRRALEHTLATGELSVFEMQLTPSGDNVPTHQCFIAAERAADGQISGAVAVGRDITERKRYEAELERHRQHLEKLVEERTHALSLSKETAEAATLAKSRFLAAASHDLRQPISAIGLYNDALALSGLNEEQKRMSHNLARSVNSLGEMLNELLDMAKLDAGKLVPQPAVIQSDELLGTLASEFDSVAREKHLSFNLYCPQRNLALFTDKNLLLTILRNLTGNAVKYTKQGGILVSIRRRGNRALIQVWDTGIGIAPEQLDLIFEEYFQAGNSERNRAKGAGLGLAIVKRVSEALGNRVSCRSRLGRGSVFEISLPLAKGQGAQAMPVQTSASHMVSAFGHLAGKRIVVIEDDAMAATAFKLLFETHGMQVTLFGTAEDALGSTEAMEADYYISDYHLPAMDGLQLLHAIQTKSAEPIKAVVLTGNTSMDQLAISQSSRWKVLFKPVALPELLSAMEQ